MVDGKGPHRGYPPELPGVQFAFAELVASRRSRSGVAFDVLRLNGGAELFVPAAAVWPGMVAPQAAVWRGLVIEGDELVW